jgi:hypothetical protein
MPSVELTNQQVVDLVRQLPAAGKRAALLALAGGADDRARRMQLVETRLRAIASERGLKWDEMSEAEREAFIDDLLHEDR